MSRHTRPGPASRGSLRSMRWVVGLLLVCCLGGGARAAAYRLCPGDTLQVTVANHAEFGGSATITADGTLLLPVIGPQAVGGLTLAEALTQLRTAYTTRLLAPELYVSLLTPPAATVYALGEVKAPGVYPLHGPLRVLDLLLTAGGLAQAPAQCSATLLCKATQLRTPLALPRLLAGEAEANLPLADGDVLLVTARPLLTLYVTGDVQVPGLYDLPDGATVAQVLACAHGVRGELSEKRLVVLRQGTVLPIDLQAFAQTGVEPVLALQHGDVLRLESAHLSIPLEGEVTHPATYTVARELSLRELLPLAGGATAAADLASVRVTHGDGTQQRLDLRPTAPPAAPYRLQPGDRVTVPSLLVTVTLAGEVKLPGSYRCARQSPLSALLLLAGGATDQAALGSVCRIHPNGQVETVDAAAPAPLTWAEGERLLVLTASAKVAVTGNVRTPGLLPFDPQHPYRLSEALVRAGGLSARSADNRVTLTRLADGKAHTSKVNLSDARRHPERDPVLQAGDTIYVPTSSRLQFTEVLSAVSLLSFLSSML